MKYCKDCKWFRKKHSDLLCVHPSVAENHSRVTGRYVTPVGALGMRDSRGRCGADATLFELKFFSLKTLRKLLTFWKKS